MTSSMLPTPDFSSTRNRRILIGSLILSLAIHLIIMGLAYGVRPFAKHESSARPAFDVELVQAQRPAVETLQEVAKDKPTDAKLESSRNLKTEEEMSPTHAPMDMPNRGGAAKQLPMPKAQKKSRADGTLFTMNQKELMADKEDRETLTSEGRGIDSAGFLARLKRGEMLKINAAESDYAQFIKRMKEKLVQHWSPQRVVTTEMYRYNEVRVDVAVILNAKGEIIELRILSGSLFSRYDEESLRALRSAGPFPNPHKSLIQDDGLVYMPWTFTLYMGGNGPGAGIE